MQTPSGSWYTMRIQPYRTLENVIEGAVITFVDISETKKIQEALQKASKEIRTLHGILPICSHCKRIRDDQGRWNQMEEYVSGNSEADFSHGICPECAKEHYPGFDLE